MMNCGRLSSPQGSRSSCWTANTRSTPVERSSHDVDVDPAVIRPMFYTSMMPSRSTRSLSSDASSPRAAPALTPPGGATASSPPDQFRVAATRGSAGVLRGHHE